MKRKYLLALWILGCVFNCIAQQRITVTAGPVIDHSKQAADADLPKVTISGPFSRKGYVSTMIFNAKKKQAFDGFGYSNHSFNFSQLDNFVNYAGTKQLTTELFSDKVSLLAFVSREDKTYVFYVTRYVERDEFTVYINEVSDDMVILGAPIIIHTFKNLKEYEMHLGFTTSDDKKQILITRICEGKSRENLKVECKLLNESFTPIWNKEFDLEVKDKDLRIREVAVDNDGNLYMLARNFEQKVFRSVLYTYFWKSQSFKSSVLGMTEGDNFGTKLRVLKGDTPVVMGLNLTKKEVSWFIDRVDVLHETVGNVGRGVMHPDFYDDSRSGKFETYMWSVKNIESLSNGNIVASIDATLALARSDGTATYYYNNNTYLIAVRNDGSEVWNHTLYKRQTVDYPYLGHLLIPAGEKVLVIYNDMPANAAKDPADKEIVEFTGMLKKVEVTIQEIDASGKVIKLPFTKEETAKNALLDLTTVEKIEDNLYYVYAMRVKSLFAHENQHMTFAVDY
jgi:hypothetical protein